MVKKLPELTNSLVSTSGESENRVLFIISLNFKTFIWKLIKLIVCIQPERASKTPLMALIENLSLHLQETLLVKKMGRKVWRVLADFKTQLRYAYVFTAFLHTSSL